MNALPMCEDCTYDSIATRRVRLEFHPNRSLVRRKVCNGCWEALGMPETVNYFCQDCGEETPYSRCVCTACSIVRGLQEMKELIRDI